MKKNNLKYKISADHTDFERSMMKVKSLAATTGKGVGVGLAAGAAVAAAGIYALSRVMAESVELANIQEEAEAKLGAVLEATGEAAGYNLEQLKAMASQMQSVTTVGDEVTLSGMAVPATFKEIRGEGFERATKAALDMSAVLDKDLKSSMLMIGKAVNDPVKGFARLSLAGVQFTREQEEQIKVHSEAGDVMGAQNIILSELETQFGGAAEALRGTFGGAVDAAKGAFHDLQEQIGFGITKNQTFIDLAKEAEETFIEWTKAIKENEEQIAQFAESTLLNVKRVVEGVGGAFTLVQKWGKDLEEVGKRNTIGALYNELAAAEKAVERLVDGFLGFGKGTPEEIEKANRKIAALIDLIRDLQEEVPFSTIRGDLERYRAELAAAQGETKNLTGTIIDGAGEAGNAIQTEIIGAINLEREALDDIAAFEKKIREKQIDYNTKAAGQIEDVWLDHFKGIEDAAERGLELENEILVALEEKNLETTNYMGEMWENFSHDVETSFRQTLGGALLGEFDSIEDAWEQMWDNMLRAFVGAIAQMITEWAALGIAGMITGKGTSGFSLGSFGGSGGEAGRAPQLARLARSQGMVMKR